MKKHGYISEAQEIEASKITIDELLKEKEKTNNNNVNANQAYIDIVYRQILKKTGYDPYTMPMEIYTYMDSALLTQIDKMQDGSSPYLSFAKNEYLFQLSSCSFPSGNTLTNFLVSSLNANKYLNISSYKPAKAADFITRNDSILPAACIALYCFALPDTAIVIP